MADTTIQGETPCVSALHEAGKNYYLTTVLRDQTRRRIMVIADELAVRPDDPVRRAKVDRLIEYDQMVGLAQDEANAIIRAHGVKVTDVQALGISFGRPRSSP